MTSNAKLALASTAISALLCLVLGEIWMRTFRSHISPASERAASLQYEPSVVSRNALPREVQTTRDSDGRVMYRINQLGYRGRDIAIPKPHGTTRVVVLGGSSAFDVGALDGRDWPHQVERILRRKGFRNVEVVNAALPGYATWDMLGRFYAEIWMLEPDYVLSYESWNDIKYFPWLTPHQPLARGYLPPPTVMTSAGPRVANPFIYYSGWLDRLLCHSQLYTHLRRRYYWWRLGQIGLEGLLTGPPDERPDGSSYPAAFEAWGPRQYEMTLRLLVSAARDAGAIPILATQARLVTDTTSPEDRKRISYDYVRLSHEAIVRAFAACDAAIYEVGKQTSAHVIDVSSALSGRSDLFSDHVHTTAKGSRAIAKLVGEQLALVMPRPVRHAAHPRPDGTARAHGPRRGAGTPVTS